MAYASVEDVQGEFKGISFTGTSNVTEDTVTAQIDQADALINSYLGMRYSVPVTADASTLALLKMFSSVLVAARIKGILEVKQETNKDANQNVRTGMSTKDVITQLQAIRDGQIVLSGATTLIAAGGAFYSRNQVASEEPVMRKDCKQW